MPHVAPYSGAMLAIVARSASESSPARAEELDELADDALLAEHLGHVSTRSVAVAPSGSAPVSFKPDDLRDEHRHGWPSIAASASMPPTPQPSTPRPLIIVVCESVPTSVSG
jgi:hypothetical protein